MPRSISRVFLWCGLLAVAAAAGGCQRGSTWNLTPVAGTVTKEGHPLAHVQVIFLADVEAGTQGPRASGFTDQKGHYRLRNDNDDGTVVGKHRVLVLVPKARREPMKRLGSGSQPKQAAQFLLEDGKRPNEQQVPPRYGSIKETPLRAEVGAEPMVFDIDIR
jgi:hypothetical protein